MSRRSQRQPNPADGVLPRSSPAAHAAPDLISVGHPIAPSQSLSARDILARARAPIDNASLVFFRIAFGALMVGQMIYFAVKAKQYWIEPSFHFTYFGFDWVRPLPGGWMYVVVAAIGVCAVLTLVGLYYRLSVLLFCVGFTYLFLIERAVYQNHYYLICLLSFLLIFIPAHRAWSLDVRRRPSLRSDVAPAWTLWVLRLQLAIVYVYAGLAKVNADWLQGEPIRSWLAVRAHWWGIGPLLQREWIVYLISYGGLIFDLTIIPALLWRRTRVAAFIVALGFHLSNAVLFGLGVFPWMALAATALFFPPEWPRPIIAALRRLTRMANSEPQHERDVTYRTAPLALPHPVTAALLTTYFLVQFLAPLRHFVYPGHVSWTEEGHEFAWHMRLRTKQGRVQFTITDPHTGESQTVNPKDRTSGWHIRTMAGKPDFILQFAHHLAAEMRASGMKDVEVRAITTASLNGRRSQALIDPAVDLAAQVRSWRPAPWIVPLHQPLRQYRLPVKRTFKRLRSPRADR